MAWSWEDHCHWLMSSHNKASGERQSHLELQSHTFDLTRIIFTILENKSRIIFKPPEMACSWEDHCHWLMSSHNKASGERQSHLELQSHTFDLTRIIFTIVSDNTRSTCKVNLQRVDTAFSCAVCGVHMCQEPCSQRYHTLRDYHYSDEEWEGPRHLKEGKKRPPARGRARTLQNWTVVK